MSAGDELDDEEHRDEDERDLQPPAVGGPRPAVLVSCPTAPPRVVRCRSVVPAHPDPTLPPARAARNQAPAGAGGQPEYSAVHARLRAHRARAAGARRRRRGRARRDPRGARPGPERHRHRCRVPTCSTPSPAGTRRPGSRSTCGPSTSTSCGPTPTSPAPRPRASRATGSWARHPATGEPALVLQGHVDVVPAGDVAHWHAADPFSARISGGVLHGRGACDMKAGVAATLAVARALHRSGVRTDRRLALHSVVSEEDGGLGAFATLRRGHGGEVAVIPEPTSGRLVTANAGALTFRIEVRGPGGARQHAPGGRVGGRGVLAGAPRAAGPRGAPQHRPAPAVRRQPAALRHLGRHRARRRLGQLGARPARRRGSDGGAAR